jgi:hypothetical protein
LTFSHKRIEDAPPTHRRILEHVERILAGHDNSLVGSIAANIMINVILADGQDVAEMDKFIDGLAAALREGVRAQLARTRAESMQ